MKLLQLICQSGSNFNALFIQFASMASKDTPKKFYKKLSGSTVISRCRLCNSFADPNYSRNLFRDATILRNAEKQFTVVSFHKIQTFRIWLVVHA